MQAIQAMPQRQLGVSRQTLDPTLLTPVQVAGILQVKIPRIYELVQARRIRAIRVGRQLRFRLPDLAGCRKIEIRCVHSAHAERDHG